MTDPNLFGRIDRVLAECDARQLPPLRPVQFEVTDADGNLQAPARFNAEPAPAIVELQMDTGRFNRALDRMARWLRRHR